MTERPGPTAIPWRRRMMPRDPRETHRASTPLELFFDLCFVVAVSQDSTELAHYVSEGRVGVAVVSYLLVFFTIWWAWMGFTWYASAFDVDDAPYRFCVMIVMAGVLVLAAGVGPAFEHRDFGVIFAGYVVMRVGLETLRARAAAADPARRRTMVRYMIGETGCMAGWALVIFVLPRPVMLWGFVVMAAAELLVPGWAERAEATPWHPDHIAERYGLFTIIVIGESVLSATNAVRAALEEHATPGLLMVAAGGLLTVFGVWWMYFSLPAAGLLDRLTAALSWGYAHFVIFATGAAIGAGIEVNVARTAGEVEIPTAVAGAAVTVPVAVCLTVIWLTQVRPHGPDAPASWVIPVVGVLVLGASWTPWPLPVTGLLMALLVVAGVVLHARKGPAG
jgi:low temperature requirement protein LtrA